MSAADYRAESDRLAEFLFFELPLHEPHQLVTDDVCRAIADALIDARRHGVATAVTTQPGGPMSTSTDYHARLMVANIRRACERTPDPERCQARIGQALQRFSDATETPEQPESSRPLIAPPPGLGRKYMFGGELEPLGLMITPAAELARRDQERAERDRLEGSETHDPLDELRGSMADELGAPGAERLLATLVPRAPAPAPAPAPEPRPGWRARAAGWMRGRRP